MSLASGQESSSRADKGADAERVSRRRGARGRSQKRSQFPRQLGFAFDRDDDAPRLTARRDLSAAAFARALTRIGVAVSRGGLPIDPDGRTYDLVLQREPLRLARRATLARVRSQLEAAAS